MQVDNYQDLIDVRGIIDVIESAEDDDESDDGESIAKLTDLLSDLAGNGGGHQWQGVWYPVTLIRDSYFEVYAEQLADDIGAIDSDAGWPLNYIDWEQAASELQIDYTTVDYDGVTYWYR